MEVALISSGERGGWGSLQKGSFVPDRNRKAAFEIQACTRITSDVMKEGVPVKYKGLTCSLLGLSGERKGITITRMYASGGPA